MIDKEEINEIIQESTSYLNNQIELTRLKATEKTSLYSSKAIVYLILGSITLLFLICASLFLGFILSEYFADFATGFGIIALAYFIILVLLFAFKKQILGKPIQNSIINELYGKE